MHLLSKGHSLKRSKETLFRGVTFPHNWVFVILVRTCWDNVGSWVELLVVASGVINRCQGGQGTAALRPLFSSSATLVLPCNQVA